MKLNFGENCVRSQPDPFIFEDGGRFYLYVTAGGGVTMPEAEGFTE